MTNRNLPQKKLLMTLGEKKFGGRKGTHSFGSSLSGFKVPKRNGEKMASINIWRLVHKISEYGLLSLNLWGKSLTFTASTVAQNRTWWNRM